MHLRWLQHCKANSSKGQVIERVFLPVVRSTPPPQFRYSSDLLLGTLRLNTVLPKLTMAHLSR